MCLSDALPLGDVGERIMEGIEGKEMVKREDTRSHAGHHKLEDKDSIFLKLLSGKFLKLSEFLLPSSCTESILSRSVLTIPNAGPL